MRLAALAANQFVADLHQLLVLIALLRQLVLHGRSGDLLALQIQPQLCNVRLVRSCHHLQLVVGAVRGNGHNKIRMFICNVQLVRKFSLTFPAGQWRAASFSRSVALAP